MILKRTILTERKGRITINVYDDIAPNLWNLYERDSININTGLGKPDTNAVNELQENERQRIANQVLEMTLTILKDRSMEGVNAVKAWNVKYSKIPPTIKSNHVDIISYCLGALFYLGILTPYEYDVMEPGFDESGHMLYVKNIPKKRSDEVTDALGDMMQEGGKER